MTAEQFIQRASPLSLYDEAQFCIKLQGILVREHRLLESATGLTFEDLSVEDQILFDNFIYDLVWLGLRFPAVQDPAWRDNIHADAIALLSPSDVSLEFGVL